MLSDFLLVSQFKFIWRFFFGGKYIGNKQSMWCIEPKTRFIKTGLCYKAGLFWCIKMWKQHKYDKQMGWNCSWYLIPSGIWQFLF